MDPEPIDNNAKKKHVKVSITMDCILIVNTRKTFWCSDVMPITYDIVRFQYKPVLIYNKFGFPFKILKVHWCKIWVLALWRKQPFVSFASMERCQVSTAETVWSMTNPTISLVRAVWWSTKQMTGHKKNKNSIKKSKKWRDIRQWVSVETQPVKRSNHGRKSIPNDT